jgi:hypothetical protein
MLLLAYKIKVQYSHSVKKSKMETQSIYLNHVRCIRSIHACTGVKVCEYLDQWLFNLHHEDLSTSTWQRIWDARRKQTAMPQNPDMKRVKQTRR